MGLIVFMSTGMIVEVTSTDHTVRHELIAA
jgi:hypothetical protein